MSKARRRRYLHRWIKYVIKHDQVAGTTLSEAADLDDLPNGLRLAAIRYHADCGTIVLR